MNSLGLRERKKQKTRWSIQDHALRLFEAQGYDQTTVEQISAAAEVSPSTFFRYFPTKEDVILQDEYDPLIERMFVEAPAHLPPMGALRHSMREAFGDMTQEEYDRVVRRMRLVTAVPAVRMRMLESLFANLDLMANGLAARTGRPATDLAIRAQAGVLIGATLVAIAEWMRQDYAPNLPQLLDEVLTSLEDDPLTGTDPAAGVHPAAEEDPAAG